MHSPVIVLSTLFSIWPHDLIEITYVVIPCYAPWTETLGMPYPPLAVFSWDVSAADIQCCQEIHLVIWLEIILLSPPDWNKISQWCWAKASVTVEICGHHYWMTSKPVCVAMWPVEGWIVLYDHKCPLFLPEVIQKVQYARSQCRDLAGPRNFAAHNVTFAHFWTGL